LAGPPWGKLYDGWSMRILIVAWSWPPIGRIGALRPVGLAREWSARGHEVHVVTGPGDRGGEYAPDLEVRANSSGAEVHRAPAPGLIPRLGRPAYERSTVEMLAPRQVSRVHQIIAQWATFPDQQRSWIEPAVGLAHELHRIRPFDVVWSTSPPESVHYVARAIAKVGVPWIADFRDQWSDYPLGRWDPLSRCVIDRISRRVLSRAFAQTGASEGICRSLRRATGRPTFCVRNGFDPSGRHGEPPLPHRLGYFGCIDPRTQHPERLWPPLRALRDHGRPWEVEMFVSPGGGGSARVEPPVDLRGLVCVKPPLPHPEALEAMQRMTALLVLPLEGRAGETQVPGKLYEYVGSGRPVLVCAPPGYEARALVESRGVGMGAWGDGPIIEALTRLETFIPDAQGRESLSRHHTAEQVLSLFESAVSRNLATSGSERSAQVGGIPPTPRDGLTRGDVSSGPGRH
jgi:glycosyltransferase involved in cell wall biosynthesis